MKSVDKSFYERLADARSNRVVLLSHCLLDENVRYKGGAFHSGAVPETHALIRTGVGICQMPCPEQRAWGGVHKPQMLRAYGLIDTRLYRFRAVLFRLFLSSTKLRYWLTARRVAREIEQYRDAGVAVTGVVGIGASPSCGVRTTLDMRRSFETIAACPLAAINTAMINERVVTACRVPGEGLFVRALRRQLRRRKIEVPFLEHDLIVEMQGRGQPLDLRTDDSSRLS
jgi:uncharacterized protein YbbK (DUF523 family)